MAHYSLGRSVVYLAWCASWALSCSSSGEGPQEAQETQSVAAVAQALTGAERLEQCRQDPRVQANLVSAEVCAGAAIFFHETFEGNGRTCGSCHPVANNYTIDPRFIADLRLTQPRDPLFVAEYDDALAELETNDMERAGILENVDGFHPDPRTRFVSRGVSHLLSLSTSMQPEFKPGSTDVPTDAVGWGGDGSPDGTLRGFLRGAIEQHFTKTLERQAGDFRLPDPDEERFVEQFQLSLGRSNELDLQRVVMRDAIAEQGRVAFLDPLQGRCNVCHSNAGANFIDTGRNRNFDTGTRNGDGLFNFGTHNGVRIQDAGFGGRDLAEPNFDVDEGDGVVNLTAFGDGTFNPPPLIEAADTGPFFHNNLHLVSSFPQNLEDAIIHYGRFDFLQSPAALELDARFGQPLDVQPHSGAITRFLRSLNASFNIAIAQQRLTAARTLLSMNLGVDVQKELMRLAGVELDDALEVLAEGADFYVNSQDLVRAARTDITRGISTSSTSQRRSYIRNALSRLQPARDQIGDNITFQLGQGNLMY